MAIYRLKSKLFANTPNASQQQARQRQRSTQQNQQRSGGRRNNGGAYNAGVRSGRAQSQSTIDSLTQKNTNLQTQLDAANKKTTDLATQINSLTEVNQELQNKPGVGTGIALGTGGAIAGMVGYGAYKQKKAEDEQQYQSQTPIY